ncbi:MAG: PD40 domain-containing protein [Anaerolineae bacterium]|nr:PD40 domain-containing protein [Anaerolineae bacterium]
MKKQPIICSNCGQNVPDLTYCPHCGTRLDINVDAKSLRRARRKAFFRRWLLPLLLLLVVLCFGILAMALRGFSDGAAEQLARKQHQADIHFNRGMVWLQVGQYEMAEAELEEALRLVADYPEANDYLQMAQQKQTVTPSPTPTDEPVATVTPSPTLTPTAQVIIVPAAEVLFKEAEAHYQNQEWEDAISKLTQIRELDSTFKTETVIDMLFESHYQYAQALDAEDALEDAISHYDAALQLRPRVQEIEDQRRWTDLYLRALGVWEIDWERVIKNLTTIYIQNTEYKDIDNRLYTACIAQAELMQDQQRWCSAAELYEQAIDINTNDKEISEQEHQVRRIEQIIDLEDRNRRLCESSPPSPQETPAIPGDWPFWVKVPLGTIIASCYDYRADTSNICFQGAQQDAMHIWIEQADQPALTPDGQLLAYRSTDPERPGLYAMSTISTGIALSITAPLTDTGVSTATLALFADGSITITTNAEAQYPTWSPDGSQIAYTAYDVDKEEWYIYIFNLNTQAAPKLIRQGQWPNWGPTGLLAMTTCQGENHCGIYLYDPAIDKLAQLTASSQDLAPTWSPDGKLIVYMSDIGKISFNLYAVDINGYVWQITRNISTDSMPIWSPDSNTVAYVTNHKYDWTIYLTPPRGKYEDKQRIAVLGAESVDWTHFRIQWIAPILKPAN